MQDKDIHVSEALRIPLTHPSLFCDHCALPTTLLKLRPKCQELDFAR